MSKIGRSSRENRLRNVKRDCSLSAKVVGGKRESRLLSERHALLRVKLAVGGRAQRPRLLDVAISEY